MLISPTLTAEVIESPRWGREDDLREAGVNPALYRSCMSVQCQLKMPLGNWEGQLEAGNRNV